MAALVPELQGEVQALAKDYATYLSLPEVHREYVEEFTQNFELMLTKLDEFGSVVDQVRAVLNVPLKKYLACACPLCLKNAMT